VLDIIVAFDVSEDSLEKLTIAVAGVKEVSCGETAVISPGEDVAVNLCDYFQWKDVDKNYHEAQGLPANHPSKQ